MGRATTLTKLQTDDPELNRLQEHLRAVLNPVLASPQFSATDFRWTQVNGADQTVADTWALQFRTTGTTWTTIISVTSAGLLVQPSWTAATFANSWVDLGAPSPATGFYKDSLGLVHVRIYVKNGTVNTAFFNLPTAYRPASDLNPCLAWSSGTGAQPLTVKANGDVGFIGAGNTSIVTECIFDRRN